MQQRKPMPWLHSFHVLLLMLFCSCFCLPLCSQNVRHGKGGGEVRIGGSVEDSFTHVGLPAFVTLFDKDSVVVDTVTCMTYERNAWFTLYTPKKTGEYTLRVEYEGYYPAVQKKEFDFSKPAPGYGFPVTLMKRKPTAEDSLRSVGLGEVVVRGTRLQVAYRGDTLVYNAEAFNIPEGAMLDALVRQLPGAEMKANGDVYINGKRLDYITLNGNDFFKGNNKVILENLPYFVVKELQVYHKDPPMALTKPLTDDEKDYVLDVVMKREYAVGTIVNTEVGAGTDDRWKAKAFALRYDERSRLTVFGNANNTNENRTPGTDGDWSPAKQTKGQLTTKQAGLNLNVNNAKKTLTVDNSSLFEWSDNNVTAQQRSETFAADGSVWGGSCAYNGSKDFTFTERLNVQARLGRSNLSTYHNLTYSNGDAVRESADSTYRSSLVNTDRYRMYSDSRMLNGNGSLLWMFARRKAYGVSISVNYMFTDRIRDNSHILRNTHYKNIGKVDTRNDWRNNSARSYRYSLATEHSYIFSQRLSLSYNLSYRQNGSGQDYDYYRFDDIVESKEMQLPSTAEQLQAALDRNTSYDYFLMGRGVGNILRIAYNWKNTSVSASANYVYTHERMRYMQGALDTVAKRSYGDFSPHFSLIRKWKKNSFSAQWDMTTSRPDFRRLMPYEDSSNALYVRRSNPALRSQKRNMLKAELNMRSGGMKPAWWAKWNLETLAHAWGNRVDYNTATGGYTSVADNVDGNWKATLTFGMNGLLEQTKKWRYDISGVVGYTHSVDFNTAFDGGENELSRVNTVNPKATCKVTYRKGALSFGGVLRYNGQFSHEEEYGQRDMNVHEYGAGVNGQYTVPVVKLTIGTDVTLYAQEGYEAAFMNTTDVVWNAFVSRPLLKGRLVAKAEMYDILHQLSNRFYRVNAQSRVETYYNSVPHYAMFSLGYKFAKKPNKH